MVPRALTLLDNDRSKSSLVNTASEPSALQSHTELKGNCGVVKTSALFIESYVCCKPEMYQQDEQELVCNSMQIRT